MYKPYRFLFIAFCLVSALSAPGHSASKSVITDTKAVIGPILELTISQNGQSQLKFGNILPVASGPTEVGPIVMIIDVKANTGERYQVTQLMSGSLENATGNKLDLENLKFKTTSANASGTAVSSATQVSSTAQVIFTSDITGSSDTISAEYFLTVPPLQEPGDYSANLTYTVSSL